MDLQHGLACLSRLAALILVVSLTGCSPSTAPPLAERQANIVLLLRSSAFNDGEIIPKKYTCDREDISPPLAWTRVPATAQSLVLIVDDPDAPIGTWVHWVLFNIDARLKELPEGATGIGVEGKNSWRRTGYGGPCPPPGKPHRLNQVELVGNYSR